VGRRFSTVPEEEVMAATISFPSKLPPGFVDRTVRRLLPSKEEAKEMDRPQLMRLVEKRKELEHLVEKEPIRFFQPNPGGQYNSITCQAEDIFVRLFLAGNKSGKTTVGAVRLLERLLGRSMWGTEDRDLTWPLPCRAAVFAEDFSSHNEVTLPHIFTWAPTGFFTKIVRNQQGHVTELQCKNGSIVYLRTYDQGSEKAEGKDWDYVWLDEPPPRDIYTAVFRGIVAYGGQIFMTGTLLKEAWLWDEQEEDYAKGFEGSIYDNQWIPTAGRDAFLKSLTDDEREVRETGRPMSLVGAIYKFFHDAHPYVVVERKLDPSWPVIQIVDPHERRPCYVLYAQINPHDELLLFDWALPTPGPTEQIFQELRLVEQNHPSRPVVTIMDPNRGAAKQLGGESWEDTWGEAGYSVQLGIDNLDFGHTAVRNYLTIGECGRPKLQFSEKCRGRGGPIFQFMRYSWEDWAKGSKMEKDSKEKPKQKNKDFPDCVRYLCAAQVSFDGLMHRFSATTYLPSSFRGIGVRRAIH